MLQFRGLGRREGVVSDVELSKLPLATRDVDAKDLPWIDSTLDSLGRERQRCEIGRLPTPSRSKDHRTPEALNEIKEFGIWFEEPHGLCRVRNLLIPQQSEDPRAGEALTYENLALRSKPLVERTLFSECNDAGELDILGSQNSVHQGIPLRPHVSFCGERGQLSLHDGKYGP